MARFNGTKDDYSEQILSLLRQTYLPSHPRAQVRAYRYNSASVRVRIIDPDFAGKDTAEREDMVWPILESLPGRILEDISVLLLLPPEEKDSSLLSLEFDDPSRPISII
jgi:stress-induced morphogen